MKIVHDLVQGSDAWLQFRLEHDGASEAAAMLGLSKTTTRSEMLRIKHLGLGREFSEWVQKNVLDHGHAVEALARPIVEAILDEDLYPVTCSLGRQSASCDGLTMDERIAFEHKQWNKELAAAVTAGDLPIEHVPQCQQVMMVTGAEKLVFVVSDGTRENMVYMWVYPDPPWFERIKAGWQQFHVDLDNYELPAPVAPAPVGKAPETLPALLVTVQGAVTASNLAEFKATALAAIRSVNRDLKTDAQFADADKAVKWCEDVESRLKAAKEHALSQTATIDALFKTMDDISTEAREVRLELEKLVKARKTERKGEIVAGGIAALAKHMANLNASLGKPYMPTIAADFAAAVSGKRNFDSMQDAVDTTLANAKIVANGAHQRISANLRTLAEQVEHGALFADEAALVQKAPDDLALVIRTRIADREAKEAKRLEAETLRIRAEEQVKAQREADARAAEALRLQRAEDARVAAEAEIQRKRALDEQNQVDREAAAKVQAEVAAQRQAEADALAKQRPAETVVIPAPLAGIIARGESPAGKALIPLAAPKSSEPATLNLGAICARLGFNVTAAFMTETLHISPAATEKAAKLYRESQWPQICAALSRHIAFVAELQAA